jgi:lysophospholipase L1-like esterase
MNFRIEERETRNAKLKTRSRMFYLALGDSYTIGEGVPLHDSFPYQVVQLLRRDGIDCNAPEIIAKTGWTTDELQSAISLTKFLPHYDFASLLIGVNNQYRGRTCEEYSQQFNSLLKKSIRLCGNKPKSVIVLSIPDWGVTPFAKEKDSKKIGKEIDQFNAANKSMAIESGVHYIDITTDSRDAMNAELLAPDGLHPSANEYRRWAMLVATVVRIELSK